MDKIWTWVIVQKEKQILLGFKKRGFGEGKWNGFGGKVYEGETPADAAKRELYEECGIKAIDLIPFGAIDFVYNHTGEKHNCLIYKVQNFEGHPKESEEMKPQWFFQNEIPYSEMWVDDQHWLPEVLSGKKITARFVYKDYSTIIDKIVSIID